MISLIKTNSKNNDFRALVSMLDQDLSLRDGEVHSFFAQFNKIDSINEVVVAYYSDVAVGCGAFKPFEESTVEIKRMYVNPDYRGRKIASQILLELEKWASSLGNKFTILETGKKQPEAIALYLKSGYTIIPNYGQYANIADSVCMKKSII